MQGFPYFSLIPTIIGVYTVDCELTAVSVIGITVVHSDTSPEQSGRKKSDSQPTDPHTDKALEYADLRSEFSSVSRQAQRSPRAERAFILSKIEMIRSDPHLDEDEKKRAIADLERGLPSP